MKKKLKNRKISYFCFILLLLIISSCDEETILPTNASINFNKTEHDFGELPLKKGASFIFEFNNDGKELLQISDVKTTCGCTVPLWTKEIIKPSKSGAIKVTYDSEHPGRFNKTITVHYNGKNSPLELKIKGSVAYPEDNKE